MADKPKRKTKSELPDTKAKDDAIHSELKKLHLYGQLIALRHLTPYLNDLEKQHKYLPQEIGAALLIVAYSALRGARRPETRDAFRERVATLLDLTSEYVENHKPPTRH